MTTKSIKTIEELIMVAETNNENNSNYMPPWQEEFYEYKYLKCRAIYDICEQLDNVVKQLNDNSSVCKTYMNKYHDEALIDCFIEISKNIERQKELLNSLFLIKKKEINENTNNKR